MEIIELTENEQIIIDRIDKELTVLPLEYYKVLHYLLLRDRMFQTLLVIADTEHKRKNKKEPILN